MVRLDLFVFSSAKICAHLRLISNKFVLISAIRVKPVRCFDQTFAAEITIFSVISVCSCLQPFFSFRIQPSQTRTRVFIVATDVGRAGLTMICLNFFVFSSAENLRPSAVNQQKIRVN
jgi:hypothetical protein